jgi:putative nucleotidyltransferase with HDIG domain
MTPADPPAFPERRRRIPHVFRTSQWRYPLGITFVLAIVVGTTLLWRYQPGAIDYKVGEVARQTVKANRTVQYVSTIRTDAARRAALEDPANIVYAQNPSVTDKQAQKLETLISAIEAAKRDTTLTPVTFRDRIAAVAPPGFPAYDIDTLFRVDDGSRLRVEAAARQTLRTTLTDRKIPVGGEAAAQLQMNVSSNDALSASESGLALDIARAYIASNMAENTTETRARQQQAAAAVPEVKVTVLDGEVVVREGDLVTADTVEKLANLGLGAQKLNGQRVAGILGLTLALVGVVAIFVWRAATGFWTRSRAALFVFLILTPLVVARFLLPGHTVLPYLFPVAGVGMAIASLLSVDLALASVAFLSVGCAFLADQTMALAAMYLLTGLVGILLAERATSTAAFLWSALALTAVGSIIAVSWRLVTPPVDVLGIMQRLAFAAINGVLSAGIAFISVTLLARLFGILTPYQLLELAHPRQPLLRQLAQDAPGTYYHSMIVGNLAEKAVEEIGGDPLLTRVGVFYHDIGKMLHPAYFIENQVNMQNIHDTLDPCTSARIIINHVTEGIDLAREAKLPAPIIDMIAQHHGTTRTEFFYQKAKEKDGESVDELIFRYPGPIPQTKENAVVMLADAVEAATRAANRAGRLNVSAKDGETEAARTAAIRTIVNRIVQDRLTSGQLADAPLTMRDLDVIERTFVAVLDGMYHPRIDYPEPAPPPAPEPERAITDEPVVASTTAPVAAAAEPTGVPGV